jgi:hypothetical protein
VTRALLLGVLAGLAVVAPAQAAGLSYRLSLAPRELMFGDPAEARVDVVIDPSAVAPESVRVHVDFRPYAVRSTTIARQSAGDVMRIEYRYGLECLARRCLPGGPERQIRFRPVRITYAGGQTQTAFWAPLQLASRVDPRELLRPTLRSEAIRQPAVTWGVRPSVALASLSVLAAALLAYPLLLGARLARRGWYVWRTTRLERLTPLERALELLRRSAHEEDERRRRALERVARELGEDALVDDARRMAWSRPLPDEGEIDSLRTRVEETR